MRAGAALVAVVIAVATTGCTDDGTTDDGGTASSKPVTTDAMPAGSVGVTEYELTWDGRRRTYRVYQPAGASGALPLLIGLHGGFGEGATLDDLTGFMAIADREQFLVAYPDGVDGNWNDGRTGVPSTAHRERLDDVGFLAAMIDKIATGYPVDPDRVYMAGISNGAMMADRFACERSDVAAAVALVAGTASIATAGSCEPTEPVSVVSFHGTGDPLVPYDGGFVRVSGDTATRGEVVSVDELAEFWVGHDGCERKPAVERAEDIDPDDMSEVVIRTWSGCIGGSAVVFHQIVGGGHTWPSGPQYLAPVFVGYTNRDIVASEEIWAFFAAHPKHG